MSEEEEGAYAIPLKKAIRAFWQAAASLRRAQEERQPPMTIAFYRQRVRAAEESVVEVRRHVSTLVVTGDDGCLYKSQGEKVDLGVVELLLARGILHECIVCEEQDDLAAVYSGDHREFHLCGDHSEYCVDKALHEYDPGRWPTYEPPGLDDHGYDCPACGIFAPSAPGEQEGGSDHALDG